MECFKEVKKLMNMPLTVMPCTGRNGYGAKAFSSSIVIMCYPFSDIKNIVDYNGAEVVSKHQLYMDGIATIEELDEVVFEGRQTAIKHIATYYDDGVAELKVVYL